VKTVASKQLETASDVLTYYHTYRVLYEAIGCWQFGQEIRCNYILSLSSFFAQYIDKLTSLQEQKAQVEGAAATASTLSSGASSNERGGRRPRGHGQGRGAWPRVGRSLGAVHSDHPTIGTRILRTDYHECQSRKSVNCNGMFKARTFETRQEISALP